MRVANLTVIRTVQGHMRGQVLKSYLESYNIPVALEYESAGLVYGITVDGLGEVRVMVPSRMARRARRLLVRQHRPVPYRRRYRRIRARSPRHRE